MFRVLIDLFNLLLWWSFMYVGSFLLLILGIVYITKTNQTPPKKDVKQVYESSEHYDSLLFLFRSSFFFSSISFRILGIEVL